VFQEPYGTTHLMRLNYVKVHAKLLYLEMMAGNIVNDLGKGFD